MPCHTGNVPLRVWILWKKNLLVEQLHIQIRLDLPEEFRLGKPECRVGCVCVPPHTERRGNWETTQFFWRNSLNVYISPDTFTFHLLGFYIFSAWEHGCGFFPVLNSVLLWCSQKELREKQSEMVKTVTAAENAINKLQLNTVSIEVNPPHDWSQMNSLSSCHMNVTILNEYQRVIFGLRNHQTAKPEVSE